MGSKHAELSHKEAGQHEPNQRGVPSAASRMTGRRNLERVAHPHLPAARAVRSKERGKSAIPGRRAGWFSWDETEGLQHERPRVEHAGRHIAAGRSRKRTHTRVAIPRVCG